MTQYVVVANGPYDDTMFIIFCVLFLLAAIFAVLSKIVSRPKYRIIGDFGKLVSCNQYEMAVRLMQGSDKKQLARELKRVMKDAIKRDKKGILKQKSRYRVAYELYRLFVGELTVKQDILDTFKLSDDHAVIIEKITKIVKAG